MTQFPERYYQSKNGVAAAQWIRDEVDKLEPLVSKKAKLTTSFFTHKWLQPTVIARYEPAGGYNVSEGIVITGTHFDTAGYGSFFHSEPVKNPAADDAASGSSAVFESLRVLVAEQIIPKRPIEFHWYAGEEFGLLGSIDVAAAYGE